MRRVRHSIAWLTAAIASVATSPVLAADEMVIWVGPASRSIPIEDLATYAETGETSRQLQIYLNDSGPEAADGIRKALNLKIQLDFVPFTQYLRSEGGACFLGQLATVVKPQASNVNAVQALRAGLINASAPDGQFSLLEFLEKYPNRQITIQQDQLAGSSDRATQFRDQFRQLLADAGIPTEFETSETIEATAEAAAATETNGESPQSEAGLPPVIPLTEIDYQRLAEGSRQICEQFIVGTETGNR
ncbi:alpha/beta hydrolase [Synechococcus sp. PCC 7336]|uniref:alpha/beta hydrolase n=1 Tax=Synechococcus sp. PCC 7336 TaxID=195250 RepID=UPI00034729D9|nr:alpha/beta hydrolase [Synechococcus sp. PCC 7336]